MRTRWGFFTKGIRKISVRTAASNDVRLHADPAHGLERFHFLLRVVRQITSYLPGNVYGDRRDLERCRIGGAGAGGAFFVPAVFFRSVATCCTVQALEKRPVWTSWSSLGSCSSSVGDVIAARARHQGLHTACRRLSSSRNCGSRERADCARPSNRVSLSSGCSCLILCPAS